MRNELESQETLLIYRGHRLISNKKYLIVKFNSAALEHGDLSIDFQNVRGPSKKSPSSDLLLRLVGFQDGCAYESRLMKCERGFGLSADQLVFA